MKIYFLFPTLLLFVTACKEASDSSENSMEEVELYNDPEELETEIP